MFRFFIALIFIFVTTSLYAIEVSDVYTAKVKLTSQTAQDQKNAFKLAFSSVLIKASGDEGILLNTAIKNEIDKHNRYLTKFNYMTENGINKLVATFDEARIKRLFFREHIPLWGRLRPLVLFWVVTEDGTDRRVISETKNSLLHNQIKTLAKQKGLPIALPLMDLMDTQNIQISDLWGRFIQPIKLASERYKAENIVVVRLTKNANSVLAQKPSADCNLLCKQSPLKLDWHLISNQNSQVKSSNQYQGIDELTLINSAVADITSTIAKRYALSNDQGLDHQLVIDVANIDSLTKYVEITRFFEKLPSIKSVVLTKAQANTRRFTLRLMSSPDSVLASFKLNKNLKRVNNQASTESVNNIPVFLWNAG